MRHESQASAPVTTQTDDLAVISDALHRLRPYRQTIVLGILAAVVAASLVGFFMYQRSPVEAIGQIRFHLVFDAASRNQYPDGTPFSPADITAHRVLLRVHQD